MTPIRVLALIPARGGSKGLPRKNLRPLGGKPLLAWSIAAARAAASVDAIVVSTDDEEIAEVARRYGAQVPCLRPAALAQDDTPDLPVFQHELKVLERLGLRPEVVVQLRPTSPLRPAGMIDEAVALLLATPGADSLRSVTTPSQTPYKMWRIEAGLLHPLLGSFAEELFNAPRQSLPAVFWQSGHIDVVRRATILEQGSLTGRQILPFRVETRYALDIDTLDQLQLADWLLSQGSLDVVSPGSPEKELQA